MRETLTVIAILILTMGVLGVANWLGTEGDRQANITEVPQ